jgi:hypothetical protein
MFVIFFATLSFSFALAYWSVLYKLKSSNLLLAELFIKNKALEEISLQIKNNENTSDESIHKENFIKFLSDSRDWAFEYIEQSQKTIKEVSEELQNQGLIIYSKKLLALLPENNKK